MPIDRPQAGNALEVLIRKAFADRCQQIAEEEIAEAQKRVETRVRAEVGKIAIEVGRHYSVNFRTDEIVITVKHEEVKP